MASSPLRASVGWSALSEAAGAGKEAAAAAMEQLAPREPKLAIAFGSSWFDQQALLDGMRSVLGALPMAGGSTAGEITPEGPRSHSCAVLLLASEEAACSIGAGESAQSHPHEAGQQAAYAAAREFPSQQRTAFLLFGDGLVSGSTDMIRGLQEGLGTSFLMAGGLTGDDLRFSRTYQYANGRAMSGGISGLLLGGGLKVGVGLEHGFAPISRPHRITRARANVLFELDRLPASSVYEEYFGADLTAQMRQERFTRQAVAFPLGMQQPDGVSGWLLRNVVAFEPDGSLRCNADVPEGASLQLMMSSPQSAMEAAVVAARQAVTSLNRVGCAIVFASAARRVLLGSQNAALEIARIREALGSSVPLIGGYTYGECATTAAATMADRTPVHTESVLVVAFGK
ncbi:MAG: FIST C-terminal domain-containing protein [Candidatus Omnitrophica bacterium]|nr:FIST C-terminal domain-containing protein [Candidatus Omnitrophota bacterium]